MGFFQENTTEKPKILVGYCNAFSHEIRVGKWYNEGIKN